MASSMISAHTLAQINRLINSNGVGHSPPEGENLLNLFCKFLNVRSLGAPLYHISKCGGEGGSSGFFGGRLPKETSFP